MKLSKSKLALAKVINENGGWPQDSEWAVQNGDHGRISFSINKPVRHDSKSWMAKGGFNFKIEVCKPIKNWHQNVLSRKEYYHAYPKADDGGWIEWGGGECPVDASDEVDTKHRVGRVDIRRYANSAWWYHTGGHGDIVAYRLHKPEVKPEFCESVTHGIPEPESIDGLCAKVTEENKHQHVDAKPTIEQLAQDYRNAMDCAERLQKDADEAKAKADEFLARLERVGEVAGLLVLPITAKKEQESAPEAPNASIYHKENQAEVDRLRQALIDAATSLETIHMRSYGEDSFLDSKHQMRSFAESRAKVAREALSGK